MLTQAGAELSTICNAGSVDKYSKHVLETWSQKNLIKTYRYL